MAVAEQAKWSWGKAKSRLQGRSTFCGVPWRGCKESNVWCPSYKRGLETKKWYELESCTWQKLNTFLQMPPNCSVCGNVTLKQPQTPKAHLGMTLLNLRLLTRKRLKNMARLYIFSQLKENWCVPHTCPKTSLHTCNIATSCYTTMYCVVIKRQKEKRTCSIANPS